MADYTTPDGRILAWRKEPEDARDYRFTTFKRVEATMPVSVNLRDKLPEVFDQLQLGSCVANAVSSNAMFAARNQKRELVASRLFVYWNARKLIGETNKDEGCFIRDAFKTISKEGLPPERDWKYDPTKVFEMPHPLVYEVGRKTTAQEYLRLNGRNLAELKQCLSGGSPFVFGFNVYRSFFSSWTETMPVPSATEMLLGGHAVLAIGYDDNRQAFLIKNSWGSDWKDGGHFWMPYQFITSTHCDDFWTLRAINFSLPPTKEPSLKEGLQKAFQQDGAANNDFKKLSEATLISLCVQLGADADKSMSKTQIIKKIIEQLAK